MFFTVLAFLLRLCFKFFNFRKIDVSKQDGKRKIIDTFINAIYVSDDDFKIVYNVNGKEENIKLEELESSTLFSNGAPTVGDTILVAKQSSSQ